MVDSLFHSADTLPASVEVPVGRPLRDVQAHRQRDRTGSPERVVRAWTWERLDDAEGGDIGLADTMPPTPAPVCYLALPTGHTYVLEHGEGASGARLDLRAFLNDNADALSIADVREICALAVGAAFEGGGGAQPVWRLRRVA